MGTGRPAEWRRPLRRPGCRARLPGCLAWTEALNRVSARYRNTRLAESVYAAAAAGGTRDTAQRSQHGSSSTHSSAPGAACCHVCGVLRPQRKESQAGGQAGTAPLALHTSWCITGRAHLLCTAPPPSCQHTAPLCQHTPAGAHRWLQYGRSGSGPSAGGAGREAGGSGEGTGLTCRRARLQGKLRRLQLSRCPAHHSADRLATDGIPPAR